ncbi:hypothetical protein ACFL0H_13325 [Thermodesulfobacteriota bacterium]
MAFSVVKFAGAGYLLFLAWKAVTEQKDIGLDNNEKN